MSAVVVTTISCDATILRCSSCQKEVATSRATDPGACECGGVMLLDRHCGESFSLRRGGLLIRCVAENKDGWRCEMEGGRDFCPLHVDLAAPGRVEQPTPRASADL